MSRILLLSLALVFTAAAPPQDRQQVAAAKVPIKFVLEGSTLTARAAASLNRCKLTFHLKPGMTNQEANDAIDVGYEKFLNCLRRGSNAR